MRAEPECVLDSLPSLYRDVLHALTLPDPAPREVLDSPARAVARRMIACTPLDVERALEGLNGLGLTGVPYIQGNASPRVTAEPSRWITEEGWKALGMKPGEEAN